MMEATEDLIELVDPDHLADRLEGRGGGLRSSKPATDSDTGLTRYVWRMARFHAGHDTTMPVTASWDLQDFLDEHGIDAQVTGVVDDAGTEITSEIEDVVDEVLDELGESSTRGAERWQQTGALEG